MKKFLFPFSRLGYGKEAATGFIEIPQWGYESFDYFGVSFNRGVIDKVCFFQYNIVREIAIFCVACLVTDRPHFFGK